MSLSNKELLDKTLFLKDSVLFISMDGKEYEVSNPEEFTGGLPIEWTGGVEMIKQFRPKGGIVWHKFSGLTKSKESGYEFRTVARLLPKEKKIYNPALSGYKPESDYKQFERKREPCAYEEECQHPACNCGKMIEPFIKECPKCRTKDFASCHSMNCPVRKSVGSSEPQEKGRNEFEKYPALAEHLERMAATGQTGNFYDWNSFLQELNKTLKSLA